MDLLILALAPVAAIITYVYYRDKYEKEPIGLLSRAFFFGILSTFPVLLVETFLGSFEAFFSGKTAVFWRAFVVAAFTEEFFKLAFLYLLIWKRPQFNEKFDGIVYAVFISMGFAAFENIMYVFESGVTTGLVRAITAVPAHFLFGVTMGFYVGLAKFYPRLKSRLMAAALVYPIILHGIYDFILMSESPYLLLFFIPFIIFMWFYGLRKMKKLSDQSVFHTDFKYEEEILNKFQNE